MRPVEIVVDGTDSGGKTPCVEALQGAFGDRRDVRTCAPFRVREVYDLWAREPRRAAMIIRAIMDEFRHAHAAADMIIWDRGWPTVWVSTADADARRALEPFPALTVLLLNSIETTRRKVEKHGLRAAWLDDAALVRQYHDAYHALPGVVSGIALAAFLPAADGRYDYADICRTVRDRLGGEDRSGR